MAPEDTTNPPSPSPSSRLNGWKEIATYFGRGVRTVQRWEKDVGLPVNRIGTGGGEVVYALVSELERWQETAAAQRAAHESPEVNGGHLGSDHPMAAPSAKPSQSHNRNWTLRRVAIWVASGIALVVIAIGIMVWGRVAGSSTGGQPASWEVTNNALRIFDAHGQFLWEKRFDFRLTESAYRTPAARQDGLDPVVIDDVDGDGNAEVLFVAEPWMPISHGLFCFDYRGVERFRYAPIRRVRFGEKTYGPPWRGAFVLATGTPGTLHDIWLVSTHLEEFPSLLEKLDVSGTPRGEYWSNGQISRVVTGDMAGRPVVFVGAISNEFKGGTLAVLDARQPYGAAPAADGHWRCADCPAGTPLAFLVFPRLDVAAAIGGHARVTNIFLDASGQIMVDLRHDVGGKMPAELQDGATSQYTLDSEFLVTAAELGQRLSLIQSEFERRGLLPHPSDGASGSNPLWPVRRWDGSGFAKITAPESRRARQP